jgi:hypothetical protein
VNRDPVLKESVGDLSIRVQTSKDTDRRYSGWFLAGVTIRDNKERVAAQFEVRLDPAIWRDSETPWHSADEESATRRLGLSAMKLAREAVLDSSLEKLQGASLFAWEDGSLATVATKMDESRARIGPIGVSTSVLVHEGRSEE